MPFHPQKHTKNLTCSNHDSILHNVLIFPPARPEHATAYRKRTTLQIDHLGFSHCAVATTHCDKCPYNHVQARVYGLQLGYLQLFTMTPRPPPPPTPAPININIQHDHNHKLQVPRQATQSCKSVRRKLMYKIITAETKKPDHKNSACPRLPTAVPACTLNLPAATTTKPATKPTKPATRTTKSGQQTCGQIKFKTGKMYHLTVIRCSVWLYLI